MADSLEIGPLLDVPITVEATLRSNPMRLSQLMALDPGSVIPLNRTAGESVDVYANNAYIGRGEWATANGHSAVRMVKFGEPD